MRALFIILIILNCSSTKAQNISKISENNFDTYNDPIAAVNKFNKKRLDQLSTSKSNHLDMLINSNSLNSIREFLWNSDSSKWFLNVTSYKIYNENNQLIGYYGVNQENKIYYHVDVELDTKGNVILETISMPNVNNIMEYTLQYAYAYDSLNQITSIINNYWDSENNIWVGSFNRIFEFDNFNNLILEEFYLFDQGGWYLKEGVKYNYQYLNGQFKQLIQEDYNNIILQYIPVSKYEYLFDQNSNLIANEYSSYNVFNSNWDLQRRNIFHYNTTSPVNSLPIRIDNYNIIDSIAYISSRLDSIEWNEWNDTKVYETNKISHVILYEHLDTNQVLDKVFKLISYYLDSNGSKTIIQYNWVDTSWVLQYKEETLFDAQKNIVSNIVGNLRPEGYFESIELYTNTYDNEDRLIQVVIQDNRLPNGQFINVSKYEYEYNIAAKIDNLIKENSFIVYPNPSANKFYIKNLTPTKSDQYLKIYTLQGKLIKEILVDKATHELEIELDTYGLYILSYDGMKERISIQP